MSYEWVGRILPVDQPIADRWGLLRAQAQMKGRPLSVIDALLAATALQHNLTMSTALADPTEMIRQGAPHLIHSDEELAKYTRRSSS